MRSFVRSLAIASALSFASVSGQSLMRAPNTIEGHTSRAVARALEVRANRSRIEGVRAYGASRITGEYRAEVTIPSGVWGSAPIQIQAEYVYGPGVTFNFGGSDSRLLTCRLYEGQDAGWFSLVAEYRDTDFERAGPEEILVTGDRGLERARTNYAGAHEHAAEMRTCLELLLDGLDDEEPAPLVPVRFEAV